MATESEGTRLVRALHARGWSDQRIGKELGRNSSLIKQVRDGKKPGNNLVPALRTLRRGRTLYAQPPRRTRKSGEPAETRRGRVRTPSGRYLHTFTKRQQKSFLRTLRSLAKRDAQISMHSRWDTVFAYGGAAERHDEEVILYAHGGRSAISVMTYIENARDPWAGISELSTARTDVQSVMGFRSVTIYEL